jgi:hypothetical protein
MEEAFEEDQGPHRAVEPVMMMCGKYLEIVKILPVIKCIPYRYLQWRLASVISNSTGLVYYPSKWTGMTLVCFEQ